MNRPMGLHYDPPIGDYGDRFVIDVTPGVAAVGFKQLIDLGEALLKAGKFTTRTNWRKL